MFSNGKKALFAVVAVFLSGCITNNDVSSTDSPQSYQNGESQVSSVDEVPISESSLSEILSSSSSDDKTYYTVMIYQSYPKRPDAIGRSDTILDVTLRIEAGAPLYTNDEGMRALADTFKPKYTPYGGYSHISLLYCDEECTVFYRFGDPIIRDSIFYYYMEG